MKKWIALGFLTMLALVLTACGNDTAREGIDLLRIVIIIAIPAAIIHLVLIITALISLKKKRASYRDKLPWGLTIFFIPVAGAIIYFSIGSKQLDAR